MAYLHNAEDNFLELAAGSEAAGNNAILCGQHIASELTSFFEKNACACWISGIILLLWQAFMRLGPIQ